MKTLSVRELKSIEGGISHWAVAGIIGGIIFIIGVIDGFIRPLKCR
ncbi:MAG: class IIb bacteriocin, lactobin A/cerein 7B family [Bacilli bacterium]